MTESRTLFVNTLCYLLVLNILILASPAGIAFSADLESQKSADQVIYSRAEKAWLLANHPVRIRIGHFPPLMFDDKEGIRGMALDYFEYIFKRNKIKFQYVRSEKVTWPESLEYIKQHKIVDMVPTAKITEERRKVMLFTQEYIFAPMVIFTRTDDTISSIEGLKGKTVSVEKGFVVGELLESDYPEIKLLVASKDSGRFQYEAIDALAINKSDAYIGNLIGTTYIIQQKGYSNIKVAAPSPFDNHNQAMAIRNDWPELVSIIDKTLDTMSLEDHKQIQNKWLSVRYEFGIQSEDVLKWGLLVVSVSMIILSIILIWNRRLKKEIDERYKKAQKMGKVGNWEYEIKTTNFWGSEEAKRIYGFAPDAKSFTTDEVENCILEKGRVHQALVDLMESNKEYDLEFQINPIDSELPKFVSSKAELIKNNQGEPIKIAGVIQDITKQYYIGQDLKKSLHEKETLLHEIHHRVKNNMAVISSLLKLQSNSIEDQHVKNILKDSQSRIYAMLAVHETLHGSENLSEIDLKSYLSKIITSIFQTYSTDHRKVNLKSDIDETPISLNQAYPLGLVVNELISNSMKHAFPDERKGEICASIQKTDNQLELVVNDNGVGISEGFDWKNSNTLGLKLVRTLVENQLDGSIDLESSNGTKFAIKFNIET